MTLCSCDRRKDWLYNLLKNIKKQRNKVECPLFTPILGPEGNKEFLIVAERAGARD